MKVFQKIDELLLKAKFKAEEIRDDISGSETTEKVGMIVVAVVIVGALAALLRTAMPGLFTSIINTAKEKLTGIFDGGYTGGAGGGG